MILISCLCKLIASPNSLGYKGILFEIFVKNILDRDQHIFSNLFMNTFIEFTTHSERLTTYFVVLVTKVLFFGEGGSTKSYNIKCFFFYINTCNLDFQDNLSVKMWQQYVFSFCETHFDYISFH